MKKRVLLYTVIFLVLLAIYQYVSMNKMYEQQNTKIEKLREKTEGLKNDVVAYKDSMEILIDQNLDLSYFSLKNNGEALAYFDEYNFDTENLSQEIIDAIYDQNSASANNPLVPFDGTDGKFMTVDKVKVINHKWVLCSFSDGSYWGEMLLAYEIDKDKNLKFELLREVLYAQYQG
ncbi:hydrolase [Kordia sp.]|uniref:hydrolase n=1 Tax=Kordia sp. TaxID=1965332 RepID=UPI003B5C11AC